MHVYTYKRATADEVKRATADFTYAIATGLSINWCCHNLALRVMFLARKVPPRHAALAALSSPCSINIIQHTCLFAIGLDNSGHHRRFWLSDQRRTKVPVAPIHGKVQSLDPHAKYSHMLNQHYEQSIHVLLKENEVGQTWTNHIRTSGEQRRDETPDDAAITDLLTLFISNPRLPTEVHDSTWQASQVGRTEDMFQHVPAPVS